MEKQQCVIAQDDGKKANLSIQWNRWLLTPIGAWPNLRKSRIGKCYSLLISIICYGLIGFMLVSCSMFLMVEIKKVYNRIKMIGPLSFFLMTFMKYYLLLLHENDIREGIECIEWDWKNMKHQEDRNIMIEYANYGRKLVLICTFFMYSAFAFYYLVLPFSVGKIEDGNLTFIQLPFPSSSLIADIRYSPYNEIVLSVQILTGVVMHAITSAACSIAAVFAVHACGQMQVLMNWLDHLVDGRSDMSKAIDDRIANIVIQHDRILKFLALTEKALQQISFVEFLGCTANMCLLGYYLIVEWNPKEIILSVTYVALIISITFNIFIFCYIGDLVAEQCQKVGEMAYMIEWYRLTGKKKLCCILIIAMSNSSVKFTAGNMVELSIYTFSDLLSGFISTSVTVGACGLAAVLAMHACGQFNVVMIRSDKLVKDNNEKKQDEQTLHKKLGFIVEHHLRTLSLVWYMEKVMNMICLVELVGCTMNMCILKYYFLTEKSKTILGIYAIVYASMVFNIFIFCYIAEIVTEQGKKVGEKFYMTEWYQLPHKTALGLVLIISRSSMVIKITAGKLIQISIATFAAVFKASFAYLNMIRTIAM